MDSIPNRISSESATISPNSMSTRFRDSTSSIPTPGVLGKPPKLYTPISLQLFIVIGVPLALVSLGIALETAIFLSEKNAGFKVPPKNVFGTISGQFLASIVPTLIIILPSLWWREIDFELRLFQPYLVLLNGNAKAEESLLLDYVYLGAFLTMPRALKYKHRLVFFSALTACMTYTFQPLAGSIFQIRQVEIANGNSSVESIKSINRIPDADLNDLNAFVAAAGFVDAAIFHGLSDPPFILNGWAIAKFVFPVNPGVEGSISVNTTAVDTKTNCANPAEAPVITPINLNLFNISSRSVDNCQHSVSFDPNSSTQQYGVDAVACPGSSDDIMFQPVMFWYFHFRSDNNAPEAKTVFCSPSLQLFNVHTTASLSNASLTSVTFADGYSPQNNVTGPPQNGRALNGLIFNSSTDAFVQARANTTRSSVPGAIFRSASQQPNGLQSTFDLPNGFLDLTSTVYTQHLAIMAGSVYFVNQNSTVHASMTSLIPRLWVDPLPAHFLAIFLILIGLSGLIIHVIHRRLRRKLLIATTPGSIASITALTARSGFGELLLPYDDTTTLERKLEGLRFRLDRRTGAILAEDEDTIEPYVGRDDAMMSLLGNKQTRSDTYPLTVSSSRLAFYAAAGVFPEQQKTLKTPYDP